MKELSIKEKAKAYDEALEKARQLCVYPTTKPFINDLQDLFPELKESEDEKARKRIIALVNAHGKVCIKVICLLGLKSKVSRSLLIRLRKNVEMALGFESATRDYELHG